MRPFPFTVQYHPGAPFFRVSVDGSGHPISGNIGSAMSGTIMVPRMMLPLLPLMVFPMVARTILREFRRNLPTSRRRYAQCQRECAPGSPWTTAATPSVVPTKAP